jgi:hypothetical protein
MTVPFTALQFMAYESSSKILNPTGRYDPYTHCFAGAVAGGFAAGITTPLDVIKTLLQTRGTANDAELRNVKGLWEAAAIIKRRDGYGGFFRGLKPRIVTTMPSTAICWYVQVAAWWLIVVQWTTVISPGGLLSSLLTSYQVRVRDGKSILYCTKQYCLRIQLKLLEQHLTRPAVFWACYILI